jgi:hypothetical protein
MTRFRWEQGEHVVAVSPTGGGKTTLFDEILHQRKYVVMFVTKLRDDTIRDRFKGYKRISDWREIRQVKVGQPNRYLLWPKPAATNALTLAKQRAVFAHALDRIYIDGGWTVVVDEEHYLCEMLRLDSGIKLYLHQARSTNLSMVNGTQRPAFIPVVTYSASTHGFLWRTTRENDLKAIAELGGASKRDLAENINRLTVHQFIYVNTRKPNVQPIISQVEGVKS